MKSALSLLNCALIAFASHAVVRFREHCRGMRAREAAIMSSQRRPLKSHLAPVPVPAPLTAATFAQIALRTLFDPSRNPDVVMDVSPPPPSHPMPPLPICYGVMNFGDGTGSSAILAETDNSQHQLAHSGDIIGEFKVVDVTMEAVVFAWRDQQIRKPLIELAGRSPTHMTAQPPAPSIAQLQLMSQTAGEVPPQPRTPPQVITLTPASAVSVNTGQSEAAGRSFKSCFMSDGLPDGIQLDGYHKVVFMTPVGQACRWEPNGLK